MSQYIRKRHPNLKGKRSHEETAAVWELAREGRDPRQIAKHFAIDAAGVDAIAAWQREQGITVITKPKSCAECGQC